MSHNKQSGFALLYATVLVTGVSLAIVSSIAFLSLSERRIVRQNQESSQALFAAESGLEDAAYRIKSLLPYSTPYTLQVGTSVATVNVAGQGLSKTVTSEGQFQNSTRNVEAVLSVSTSTASFFYGVQVGAGGFEMNNNARVNGNVYSNGNILGSNGARVTGTAVAAGSNHRIEQMIIGDASSGEGRASQFVNTTIHGSSCPNQYCIVENPAPANLPVADAMIQEWKDLAVAGGVTSGDVTVSGTVTLGPKKITGKLTVTNGSTLTINGTLWVVGDIVFDNNSVVQLSPGYGSMSGVVISDAKIDVKNGAVVRGSGDPASYTMLLAAKDSTGEEIIKVDNNSSGVIYYAGKGWIKFSNNAEAKEATAYGIRLDNNAVITYDSGLASANFSAGPGATFDITSWKEKE